MPAYKAPLREIRFVLYELLKADSLSNTVPAYAEATPETIDAILEAAGQFCEEELQPLNHPGDEEGCHFDSGVVTTPKGFKEAMGTTRRRHFICRSWSAANGRGPCA